MKAGDGIRFEGLRNGGRGYTCARRRRRAAYASGSGDLFLGGGAAAIEARNSGESFAEIARSRSGDERTLSLFFLSRRVAYNFAIDRYGRGLLLARDHAPAGAGRE